MNNDQIWELYVGKQSPGEWLRDMDNTTDGDIATEVRSYLGTDPVATWLDDAAEPDGVESALIAVLIDYRDRSAD